MTIMNGCLSHQAQGRTIPFLLLSFLLTFSVIASGETTDESSLPLHVDTNVQDSGTSLGQCVFWTAPSASLEFYFLGGKVSVPLEKIRRASFSWSQNEGDSQLILEDGNALKTKVKSPDQAIQGFMKGLPVPVKVSIPLKTIASWEKLSMQIPASVSPSVGSKLFGRFIKDGTQTPDILIREFKKEDLENKNWNNYLVNLSINEINFQCPAESLKKIEVKGDTLQIILADGTILRGKGNAPRVTGKFMDMPIEVEGWQKGEFFWKGREIPTPASRTREKPAPGSLLIASVLKGGVERLEIVIGKLDNDGKFADISNSSIEPSYTFETSGMNMETLLSTIQSIAISGDKVTILLSDGKTITGMGKAQMIRGSFNGQPATIDAWERVDFSWKAEGTQTPSPSPADAMIPPADFPDLSWNERYYESLDFPGRRFVLFGFLNSNAAESYNSPITVDYKGVEIDITKGARSYSFNPNLSILPNGDNVPIKTSFDEYIKLYTEYFPSVPARIIMPKDGLRSLTSGVSCKNNPILQTWNAAIADSGRTIWIITDLQKRTYLVRNLRGYQQGEGYNDPPAGYYYIGGYYTEDILSGGSCAIIAMNKGAAHIPLGMVDFIDAQKGVLTIMGRTQKESAETLRGFSAPDSGKDDINNYLRTAVIDEWRNSVFLAESEMGLMSIPIWRCAGIQMAKDPVLIPQPETDLAGFTIKVQTTEGSFELRNCFASYSCEDADFPKSDTREEMAKAPKLLILGKDEEHDDPNQYKIAALVIEIPEGPTYLLSFNRISSIRNAGDLYEIQTSDNRILRARFPFGSLTGQGPLGETAVPFSSIKQLDIQH